MAQGDALLSRNTREWRGIDISPQISHWQGHTNFALGNKNEEPLAHLTHAQGISTGGQHGDIAHNFPTTLAAERIAENLLPYYIINTYKNYYNYAKYWILQNIAVITGHG